jgi:hypothetical protein
MKKLLILFVPVVFLLMSGCKSPAQNSVLESIKAYDIDFNWGEGGPNGFARPGLWADADPAAHVNWYADLGCNVIQSFAVSCNGYAWYKNGIVPEQPGLVHDFLAEQVRLAHKKNIRVFGYFCAGSNTRWGQENPDLSYGIPQRLIYHIPQNILISCVPLSEMQSKRQISTEFLSIGCGIRELRWNLILP